MAEAVVDVLEMVDVDEEQGAAAGLAGSVGQRVEPALEDFSVRQTGQLVLVGELPDPLFGRPARGNVGHAADEANGSPFASRTITPRSQNHR